MNKKYPIVIAIVLLFSLGLVACGENAATTTNSPAQTTAFTTTALAATTTTSSTATTTAVSKYGGIYRTAFVSGPSTPIGYPAEADTTSLEASEPALECFFVIKAGGVIQPILATDVKTDPGNKTITLTLRKGVKFHDGTDFNAAAAKWNLDKNIEAKKFPEFKSVDIIDDHTVRINVSNYTNLLLSYLATYSDYGVISPTAVEKNGLEWARWHPVGTGPFKFVKYDRDSKLVYERNPDYWDKGKPYLDGLEIVVIKDETVRKMAFEKGDIDHNTASGITAKELKEKGFPYLTLAGATFALIPDSANSKSPLAKKNVRMAISYAIDREEMADTLSFGFASPSYQLWSATANVTGVQKTSHDPAKAKQLLADAGYPNGFEITIHSFIAIVPKDYINALAAMLGEVGIKVTTDFPEGGRYSQLRSGGWDDGFMGHCLASDINLNSSIQFYFDGPAFPSVQRPTGWRQAMDASLNSPNYDPNKMQDVIKLISDDMMVIPYLEEIKVTFLQKGVHDTGYLDGWVGSWTPGNIWFDPEYRHK